MTKLSNCALRQNKILNHIKHCCQIHRLLLMSLIFILKVSDKKIKIKKLAAKKKDLVPNYAKTLKSASAV